MNETKQLIMSEKIKGVVKWFSNRKGFGFITPHDNDKYTKDIFVHVTGIIIESDRYRTLKDGFETEFEVLPDENGSYRAVNITSADGSPCPGTELRQTRSRQQRRSKKKDEHGDEVSANDNKEIKRPYSWGGNLEENVQVAMKSKDIEVDGGRAFLSIGDARVKLGTDGYAALAHVEAILAEGKWDVLPNGIVSITWDRVLKLDENEWTLSTVADVAEFLLSEINLSDISVQPTRATETADSLWGEGKVDPKIALETHGFLMRRIILNAAQSGRGRRRGRGRRPGNKKNGSLS